MRPSAIMFVALVLTIDCRADTVIGTRIVDKIEFDGLSKEFCMGVGRGAFSAKRQRADVYDYVNHVEATLKKATNLSQAQIIGARRLTTLLSARIYASTGITAQEVEKLSDVECLYINQFLQGAEALRKIR